MLTTCSYKLNIYIYYYYKLTLFQKNSLALKIILFAIYTYGLKSIFFREYRQLSDSRIYNLRDDRSPPIGAPAIFM